MSPLPRTAIVASVLIGAVWSVALYLLLAATKPIWLSYEGLTAFQWLAFLAPIPLVVYWLRWSRTQPASNRLAVATACYPFVWAALVFSAQELGLTTLRAYLTFAGQGMAFLMGLAWIVWIVEWKSRAIERQRIAEKQFIETASEQAKRRRPVVHSQRPQRIWNPFDLQAWYYTGGNPKLNQSLFALISYTVAFAFVVLILSNLNGCQELYEMPAGGGVQNRTVVQRVKIQKVEKKKFVINPYSSIIFNPPPIDDLKLELNEASEHLYQVGYGAGEGAGYGGGKKGGKIRFIRLEYQGGDWNRDFGSGDLNMLIEYGLQTGQKVADAPESRTILQLKNFPEGASPPFVYMTGQRDVTVSKAEVETLRDYLLVKHGMLLADNGGSRHWHNQIFSLMNRVLPETPPVKIPLDDVIHRQPNPIPFLPYVAPHGGKDAYGWKVDGRWVVYYHPGDMGDAWVDDHAGVDQRIWRSCFNLGVNVINYAHVEYSKWLTSRQK
ncbi:MAG TPA: DUF4159 domain-containing protein [Pirellulales bacterium]